MTTIVKPNTFSTGATIVASEHNDNFDTIYNDYNGSIKNANIASDAAILSSKLNFATDIAWSTSSTTTDILAITGNSLTSGSALVISSSGTLTDALAKFTASAATSGNGITLTCGALTSGEALQIDIDGVGMTSARGIQLVNDVNSTGNTWTGNLVYLKSNNTDTASRNLLEIVNDNSASTGTSCLKMQQDAGATALNIDHNGTGGSNVINVNTTEDSGIGFRLDADSLTTGRMVLFATNSTSTSDRNLIEIANSNTAANNTSLLFLNNDATDAPADADKGYALHIDFENLSNSPAIRLDGCANTTDNNVACVFTASRGPTGAQTDIQGFIEINIDGTKRFVPFW